jgi:amidohydrolase
MCPRLDADIERLMIEIRQALHAEPELSHHEYRTVERVHAALLAGGVANIRPAAATGLVADITGEGGGGRTLLLRADLDALPIGETTGLAFRSRHAGVMHACGHDTHTAMVLAAALQLQRSRAAFSGTVRCVFQPAEELEPYGARAILAEGWLEGVDAALCLHVDPSLATGTIGVRAGACNCSADAFEITVTGRSSHGGKPHEGIDAIAVAAGIVQELQKIPARHADPNLPLVITVGTIEGGTAGNIVAERVAMRGTIRARDEAMRAMAKTRLLAVAEGLAAMHGASATIAFSPGQPAAVNHPAVVALVEKAGAAIARPGANIVSVEPWSAGDDFAFYAARVPSAYVRIGVADAALGTDFPLHHPRFAVDERALPIGAELLIGAAEEFLAASH